LTYKGRVAVTGAAGFIGHHLTSYLKARSYWVGGVDVKRPEYETTHADEFLDLDLRYWGHALLQRIASTKFTPSRQIWAA
jgi:nucleoside-diphosphate-sugar epimerase